MRKLVVLVGLVAMLATSATSTAAAIPPFPNIPGAWTHVDLNVRIGRKPHTLTLDRGRITQISSAQLTLHENDGNPGGTSVVIPLTSFAIVRIANKPAAIFQLKRGMSATTMRIDGGPAVRIRVPR